MRHLLILSLSTLTVLGLGYGWLQWQKQLRAERPLLPLTFAHIDHRPVNCIDCHTLHGSGGLIKRGSAQETLCLGCHNPSGSASSLDNNFAYSGRLFWYPIGEWGQPGPAGLEWQYRDDTLVLEFELPAGAYATSVLRELVTLHEDPK